MEQLFRYRMNRRAVLGAAAGLGLGVLLVRDGDKSCAAPAAPATLMEDTPKHNMWVWRFDVDGPPDQVLERVRSSGMGVLLKTNEGHEWMSSVDDSPTAIMGPEKVHEMVNYFESAGVPFHAWCVVKGLNPVREAEICSDVLNAGARSMTFDLEPPEGHHYWQADRATALEFGREMRRLQPNARLGVAPDARPWQIDAVPLVEFASFCDEILPQSYWQTFNSPTNRRFLTERGYYIGPEGVTPEVVLDATADKLRPLGRVIRPIGQGTANAAEWERFVRHAYSLEMDSVSVWRYGTASGDVWPTLAALAPVPPAPPAPLAVAEPQQAPAVQDAAQQPPPPAENAADQAPEVTAQTAPPEAATEQQPAAPESTPASEEVAVQASQEPQEPAVTAAKRSNPWTGPDLSSARRNAGSPAPTVEATQSALESCEP